LSVRVIPHFSVDFPTELISLMRPFSWKLSVNARTHFTFVRFAIKSPAKIPSCDVVVCINKRRTARRPQPVEKPPVILPTAATH
jgi:hypothetical protein